MANIITMPAYEELVSMPNRTLTQRMKDIQYQVMGLRSRTNEYYRLMEIYGVYLQEREKRMMIARWPIHHHIRYTSPWII